LIELVARRVGANGDFSGFSDLLATVPSFPSTGENKIHYAGERAQIMGLVEDAFSELPCLKIDGVRVIYPEGWFLCRPSNTEPVLVMRAEALTTDSLASLLSDVSSRLAGIVEVGELV